MIESPLNWRHLSKHLMVVDQSATHYCNTSILAEAITHEYRHLDLDV